MSKKRKLYYECVHQVDMNYLAPDHRKERWDGLQAPIIEHGIRFHPEDPLAEKPPDILVTERPLARHLTTEITRNVRRKNLRTGEYEMKPATTKVKFELLDPEDITDDVRRRARELNLPESSYEEEVVHA